MRPRAWLLMQVAPWLRQDDKAGAAGSKRQRGGGRAPADAKDPECKQQ